MPSCIGRIRSCIRRAKATTRRAQDATTAGLALSSLCITMDAPGLMMYHWSTIREKANIVRRTIGNRLASL